MNARCASQLLRDREAGGVDAAATPGAGAAAGGSAVPRDRLAPVPGLALDPALTPTQSKEP
jgi:hypothetical protein